MTWGPMDAVLSHGWRGMTPCMCGSHEMTFVPHRHKSHRHHRPFLSGPGHPRCHAQCGDGGAWEGAEGAEGGSREGKRVAKRLRLLAPLLTERSHCSRQVGARVDLTWGRIDYHKASLDMLQVWKGSVKRGLNAQGKCGKGGMDMLDSFFHHFEFHQNVFNPRRLQCKPPGGCVAVLSTPRC